MFLLETVLTDWNFTQIVTQANRWSAEIQTKKTFVSNDRNKQFGLSFRMGPLHEELEVLRLDYSVKQILKMSRIYRESEMQSNAVQ